MADPHRFVRSANGGDPSPFANGSSDSNTNLSASSPVPHARTKSVGNGLNEMPGDDDWRNSLSGWRHRRREILATSLSTEMLNVIGIDGQEEPEEEGQRRPRIKSFKDMVSTHHRIIPVFDDESGNVDDVPVPRASSKHRDELASDRSNDWSSIYEPSANRSQTKKPEVNPAVNAALSSTNPEIAPKSTSSRLRGKSWWTEPDVQEKPTKQASEVSDAFPAPPPQPAPVQVSAPARDDHLRKQIDDLESHAPFMSRLLKEQLKTDTTLNTSAYSSKPIEVEPSVNGSSTRLQELISSSPKRSQLNISSSGQRSASTSPNRMPRAAAEAQVRKDVLELSGAPTKRLVEDITKSPVLARRLGAPQPYRPITPNNENSKQPVAYSFDMSDHDYNAVSQRTPAPPIAPAVNPSPPRSTQKFEPITTTKLDAPNNFAAAPLQTHNDNGLQIIQESRRRVGRQNANETANQQAQPENHTRSNTYTSGMRVALGSTVQSPPSPPPPPPPPPPPVFMSSAMQPAPSNVANAPILPHSIAAKQSSPVTATVPQSHPAPRGPAMPAAPAPVRSNADVIPADRLRTRSQPSTNIADKSFPYAPPSATAAEPPTTTAVIVRQRHAPRHAHVAGANSYAAPALSIAPENPASAAVNPPPTVQRPEVNLAPPQNNLQNARNQNQPARPTVQLPPAQSFPQRAKNPVTQTETNNEGVGSNGRSSEPNRNNSVAASGQQVCAGCQKGLSAGSAMYIEQLRSVYHLTCFVCANCRRSLVGSDGITVSVYIRDRKLLCLACSQGHPSTPAQNQFNAFGESSRLPSSDAFV